MRKTFSLRPTLKRLFSVSDEELNKLPQLQLTSRVTLIDRISDVHSALKKIEGEKVLGFDTETKPTFRKGEAQRKPCLMQISSANDVLLFRINQLSWQVPTELVKILQNPDILKVGVGIVDDQQSLQKHFELSIKGICDLQVDAKKMLCAKTGLRHLTAVFLQKRMSKGAQTTNWEIPSFTQSQISYAALDAWAGREVFFQMKDQWSNFYQWFISRPDLVKQATETYLEDLKAPILRVQKCANIDGLIYNYNQKQENGNWEVEIELKQQNQIYSSAKSRNSNLLIAQYSAAHSILTALKKKGSQGFIQTIETKESSNTIPSGLTEKEWIELQRIIRETKPKHPHSTIDSSFKSLNMEFLDIFKEI